VLNGSGASRPGWSRAPHEACARYSRSAAWGGCHEQGAAVGLQATSCNCGYRTFAYRGNLADLFLPYISEPARWVPLLGVRRWGFTTVRAQTRQGLESALTRGGIGRGLRGLVREAEEATSPAARLAQPGQVGLSWRSSETRCRKTRDTAARHSRRRECCESSGLVTPLDNQTSRYETLRSHNPVGFPHCDRANGMSMPLRVSTRAEHHPPRW